MSSTPIASSHHPVAPLPTIAESNGQRARPTDSGTAISSVPLSLEIRWRTIIHGLAICLVILIALNLLGLVSQYYFGQKRLLELVRLIDVDQEMNVPTLFSTLLWLFNASLFAAVWRARDHYDPHRSGWLSAALLCVFLGIDEFSETHERFSTFVNRFVGDIGIHPQTTWTFVYATGTVVVVLLFSRWLLSLDRVTRVRLLGAGALFVLGAIGFELIEGWYHRYVTLFHEDVIRQLFTIIEESLEMTGLILCARALLLLLLTNHGSIRLMVSADDGTKSSTTTGLG